MEYRTDANADFENRMPHQYKCKFLKQTITFPKGDSNRGILQKQDKLRLSHFYVTSKVIPFVWIPRFGSSFGGRRSLRRPNNISHLAELLGAGRREPANPQAPPPPPSYFRLPDSEQMSSHRRRKRLKSLIAQGSLSYVNVV